MKRSVLFILCSFVFVFSAQLLPQETKAEVAEGQLEQYLSSIHWTTGDLVDYLAFYDISIADFENLEQLKSFLGTPINNDNLGRLLQKYNMTEYDLETLLAEYGETLADYKFIEDVDLDIEFFLQKHNEFSIVTDFLSLFGLTEDEMENLFEHFSSLDEQILEENLANIFQAIEERQYLQGVETLSLEEQSQLFTLWNNMLSTLNIDARYYLVKDDTMTPVELHSLLEKERLAGNSLFMALHNLDGDMLATLVFSEEMIDSHLMYESLEQLGEVAALADEYQQMAEAAKLPITAGNYSLKIILSLFIISLGSFLIIQGKRRVYT